MHKVRTSNDLSMLAGMAVGGLVFAGLIGAAALNGADKSYPHTAEVSVLHHADAELRREIGGHSRHEPSDANQFLNLVSETVGAPTKAEEVRIALVIGNANYTQPDWRLDNPLNDAELIAQRLTEFGFDVDLVPDAKKDDMHSALIRYDERMKAAGQNAVSVVYYAGHGIQDNDINFLVPVDADIKHRVDIDHWSKRLDSFLQVMRETKNYVNLVFIDACRTSPFVANEGRGLVRTGMAEIKVEPNFLISFAAQSGRPAADGYYNDNSPYTTALAAALEENAEDDIKIVLADVRVRVLDATEGEQMPETRELLIRAPRWAFRRESDENEVKDGLPPREPPEAVPGRAVRNVEDFLATQDFSAIFVDEILGAVAETYGFDTVKSLADRNVAKAMVLLGEAYLHGRYTEKDPLKALQYHLGACEVGEMSGCTGAGFQYSEKDMGPERDMNKAEQLFKKACDGKNAVGCINLGLLKWGGDDFLRNDEEAFEYFQRACDGRNMEGCFAVGLSFASGRGVAKNPQKAASHYRDACNGGVTSACSSLGSMYLNGEGLTQNYDEAARLLGFACDDGQALACNSLGVLYFDPNSGRQDLVLSFRFLQRACEGKNAKGCSNLAIMYEEGRGVPQDLNEAHRYRARACEYNPVAECRDI